MADENPNEIDQNPTPNPLFVVDDSTKEFFDTYIGPGKKYPNIGELAKAYANADRHIEELRRDTGKYKTEAESLKELMMQNLVDMNAPKPNDNEPDPNDLPNDEDRQPQPDDRAPPKDKGNEVDLKALVKEALGEVSVEEKRQTNARTTEEATIKRFGSKDDAVKAIQAKAEELGLSAQWIANLAFESPKAYYATMGFQPDETPKSTNTPAPGSDVNPAQFNQNNGATKPGTYKWYQELRKSDPGKYRTQAVQQAILKDAAENPNFYS